MGDAPSTPRPRAHFTDLDGMRGVLAVVVMLLHLGLNTAVSRATGGWLIEGQWQMSVDFFFILSGFVLYFPLARARPTFRAYVIKRLRRLAPMALLTTLLILPVSPFHWSGAVIAANLLMVQTFFRYASVNQSAWSIPLELFFPALALPLLGSLGRAPRWLVLALLAATGLVVAVLVTMLTMRFNAHAARGLFGLAFGMLLGRLKQAAGPGRERPAMVLAVFVACLVVMGASGRLMWLAPAFPPLAALAIFHGTQTRTIFSTPPVQALGRWSYAIYLLHMPLVELVRVTIAPVDKNLPAKAVVVVLTLIAAAFAYRFIERPLMQGRAAPAETAP